MTSLINVPSERTLGERRLLVVVDILKKCQVLDEVMQTGSGVSLLTGRGPNKHAVCGGWGALRLDWPDSRHSDHESESRARHDRGQGW